MSASAAAIWFLSMKFFADQDPILLGPFTEQECVQCGEMLDARAKELQKRFGRKAGPGWVCIPRDPGDPPPPVTVRKGCEGG